MTIVIPQALWDGHMALFLTKIGCLRLHQGSLGGGMNFCSVPLSDIWHGAVLHLDHVIID